MLWGSFETARRRNQRRTLCPAARARLRALGQTLLALGGDAG